MLCTGCKQSGETGTRFFLHEGLGTAELRKVLVNMTVATKQPLWWLEQLTMSELLLWHGAFAVEMEGMRNGSE